MINNGIEYKGIFYNETKEKRYYEGGAHFKYKQLYSILSQLAKVQNEKHQFAHQKQLTTSQSMPSIHDHIASSQKKIIMIKLKKDTNNLNSSLPNADEIRNKKILLPPASNNLPKSRNTAASNNNYHNMINQPYSFNLKYHSSIPKNKNNSFIKLSTYRKQTNNLNNISSSNTNNLNYSSILVPVINHNHSNEQNINSRNRKIPVTSMYSNLTNVKIENKNVNESMNGINRNMMLTLKKERRLIGNNSGINDSSSSVVYNNNNVHSRNGSGIIIGRHSAINLKKTFVNSSNSNHHNKNEGSYRFGINQIINANKKFDGSSHKLYKNALMFQMK
jgi:hypothetical protein